MSCHVNWIGLEDWSRFTESVKKIITLCGKSSWQTVDSVVTGGSHYSYTVHEPLAYHTLWGERWEYRTDLLTLMTSLVGTLDDHFSVLSNSRTEEIRLRYNTKNLLMLLPLRY